MRPRKPDDRRPRKPFRPAESGPARLRGEAPAGPHRGDDARRSAKPRFGKPDSAVRARPDGGPYAGRGPDAGRDTPAGGARPPGKPRKPFRGGHDDGPVVLYGWHSVKAALENPQRSFVRLLATENAARRLAEDGLRLPITPDVVRPELIVQLAGPEAVHQGLYAEAEPLPSPALEEVATAGILLAFDQITDPHNVGAILRSAAAFGVKAAVTTARHSPEATGVLAKAASGALEYVPIVTVGNLAQALQELRDYHTLVVGLDSTGEIDFAAQPLTDPLALVLGAEGKGLRQLTRTRCNVVARLDLPGRIKSLNVSNATALALYIATSKLAG